MKPQTQDRPSGIAHGYYPDKGIFVVLASAAVIGSVYFVAQSHESILYVLANALAPVLAFAAFAMALAALLRNGVRMKDRISIVWLSYSLGMLLWLMGESMWAVYTLWYSIAIPFPSAADIFWLVGYVPLMSAMVAQVWPFREFFHSRKMLIAISLVILMAGLLLATLVPPTYASEAGADLVEFVVSLAYPLFDAALLAIALPVLFLFGKGLFWRPFLFVTIGLILAFFGDILFSWATLTGVYYDGSYLELCFHWSYLVLSYGFWLKFRTGAGIEARGQP